MDHIIEYFHTLVEHEFTQDQYEVSFHEGKYHITITIPDDNKSPMTYYIYMMYQKKMERCLEGFVKPENRKISVVLPIRLINHNLEGHYARLNRILRVDSSTHTE
jgi:hypothetical protein